MPAGWVAAAAVVTAAVISSDSSRKASHAQSDAENAAITAQQKQADTDLQNNLPRMQRGDAAGKRLQYLMGLGDGKISQDSNATPKYSAEQLRAELLPQFTTNTLKNQSPQSAESGNVMGFTDQVQGAPNTLPTSNNTIDEAGLQAAINSRISGQGGIPQTGTDPNADPAYGSLLRKFSQSDLEADPVYQNGLQFGLNQGVGALNKQSAAGGSLLSGAALKAVTRFGNDYGSTKANESYNRSTNDQSNSYNRLAGINGTAQVASNAMSTSGMNAANQISNALTGQGNARASGYIAQGNAYGNALSQGANAYNQYNAMNNNNGYQSNSGGYGYTSTNGQGTNDASYWE